MIYLRTAGAGKGRVGFSVFCWGGYSRIWKKVSSRLIMPNSVRARSSMAAVPCLLIDLPLRLKLAM
jgi:hypothetical protein